MTLSTYIALVCLTFVCAGIVYYAVNLIKLLIERNRQERRAYIDKVEKNRKETFETALTYDFYAQK